MKFPLLSVAAACALVLAWGPRAEAAVPFPGVGLVSAEDAGRMFTLTLPYHGRTPVRAHWMRAPERLVLDLEGMPLVGGRRAMVLGYGVVQELRAAALNATTTRLVFDCNLPADVKLQSDGLRHQLVVSIFPRGLGPAPVARYAPQPLPRITPEPVAMPYVAVPTPKPTPTPEPEPTPEPTPDPTPIPLPSEDPGPMVSEPSPLPTEVPNLGPPKVFGSRLWVGGEVPLGVSEVFPGGQSDATTGLSFSGGAFGYEQMFTDMLGMSLKVQAVGMKYREDGAAQANLNVIHDRMDVLGQLGLRFRLGLPANLEVMVEPVGAVRTVQAGTQVTDAIDPGLAVALPQSGTLHFLGSNYLSAGGGGNLGLGWRVAGPFSLVAQGGARYLFVLSQTAPLGSPSISPLLDLRADLEARADFGNFGLALGFSPLNRTMGANSYTQSWMGPYARLGMVF